MTTLWLLIAVLIACIPERAPLLRGAWRLELTARVLFALAWPLLALIWVGGAIRAATLRGRS